MSWHIPRIWEGGECWIIGGGPSIPQIFGVPQDIINKVYEKELPMSAFSPFLSPIHGKHVIAVNMAFKLGDWVDLMFFGDGGFYFKNRRELMQFPKPRITCNPNISKRENIGGIKFVNRDGRVPLGLSTRQYFVSWNRNSGAAAISLATQMGATLIFLLGFDMNLDTLDRQHWHSEYPTAARKTIDPRRLPFKRHLQCFGAIKNDAEKQGVEIINVSPKSKITEFKKMDLKEALEYGKSRKGTESEKMELVNPND